MEILYRGFPNTFLSDIGDPICHGDISDSVCSLMISEVMCSSADQKHQAFDTEFTLW